VALLRALADELGCEVVNFDEMTELLSSCLNPVAYDGFEPSGRMHIAQGLMKTCIVNEMGKCGFTFVMWIADWFAKLNLKMGGDMAKI
jgi:tyrosyl-tRNA synthetase